MKVAYIPVCLGGGGRSPAFNSSLDLTGYYSGPRRAWREKVFYVLHYYGEYLSCRRAGSCDTIYEIDDMFRTNLRKVHLGNEGENLEYSQVIFDYEDFESEHMDSILVKSPDYLQRQVLSLLRKEGLIISDREVMVGLMVEQAHKYMLGQVDEKLVYTTSSRRDVWGIKPKGLLEITTYLYERQFDRSFEECNTFFPRGILDDLYRRDEFSLNVSIDWQYSAHDPGVEILTDREVKLYQLFNWLMMNLEKFRLGIYEGMPRDLLDDDPFIVELVKRLPEDYVIIITADKRLAYQLLNFKNRVLRISPELVTTGKLVPDLYPKRIIEDTGSVEAWHLNHHNGELTILTPPAGETRINKRSWQISMSFRKEPIAEYITRQNPVLIWDWRRLENLIRTI